MNMNAPHQLKALLDRLAETYECPTFIEHDPIQVPHHFVRKEDIEISAFLTATISWGQRVNAIKSALKLMNMLDNAPYDFLLEATPRDWQKFNQFFYRTFQADDCIYFLKTLKRIYQSGTSLEKIFTDCFRQEPSMFSTLMHFRKIFLAYHPPQRTAKHIADVTKGSAAKRLNMFLRWMVRSNQRGVDFGLWKDIPPAALIIPMDVHVVASVRKLGLLSRKTIDWKAAEEITGHLRQLDPNDPIKYDFALFGMNINKS